jgi:hypothetical protein
MTPFIATESLRIEMAKHVHDFVNLVDFVRRLRAAGYTDREIIDHGGDIWKRERLRQKLQLARAA